MRAIGHIARAVCQGAGAQAGKASPASSGRMVRRIIRILMVTCGRGGIAFYTLGPPKRISMAMGQDRKRN
jgi:hypothetical protein